MIPTMSVKTRIILYVVAAGIFTSFLFSVTVFFELIEQPFDLLDSFIEETAYSAADIYDNELNNGSDISTINLLDNYWVEIRSGTTNEVLYKNELARTAPLAFQNPGSTVTSGPIVQDPFSKWVQASGHKTPFRVRCFEIRRGNNVYYVQVARPMDRLEDEISELTWGILSGLLFSAVCLIAVSGVVASRTLRPIKRMQELTQKISEKNLAERLPVGNGKDEFGQLSVTVNNMLDRLQYSFNHQREFLFATSHELKTPLTTIRLAMDTLGSQQELMDFSPEMEENYERLKTQVLRMERLVKDLLNLSSLESTTSLDKKQVDLSALLAELEDDYKLIAEAQEISIETDIQPGLTLEGDKEKLRRAFSNIIDNALKYNVSKGTVWIRATQKGKSVETLIENTGAGIDKKDLPKVFTQFYRTEKSRSTKYGGAGLGLAIVKSIIELHKGTITIDSNLGDTTKVVITLGR
jgi:signal transduction histidine kinase